VRRKKVSNLYKSLSFTFKDRVVFGQAKSSDVKLMEKYKIESAPKIILITSNDVLFYDGENSKHSISQFLLPHISQHDSPYTEQPQKKKEKEKEKPKEPIIPKLHFADTQESFDESCKSTGLCFVAFLDPTSENHEQHIGELNTVLAKFPSVPFLWINGPSHIDFGKAFNLADGYPQGILLHQKKLKYKTFLDGFDSEQISEFVELVLKGKGRISSLKSIPQLLNK